MNLLYDVASSATRATGAEAQHKERGTIVTDLTSVIAEATRYPADILEPHADFEHDLGIDSVKLGEIIVLVRQRYGFGDEVKMDPDRLRTIASTAAEIENILHARRAFESTVEHAACGTCAEAESTSTEALIETITRVVANATRYPTDILERDADFEHDLDIDSVKLGEIVVILRSELGLPDTVQLPVDRFRTIGQSAAALAEMSAPRDLTKSNGVAHVETSPSKHPGQSSSRSIPDLLSLINRNAGLPFKGKTALVTGSGHGIGKVLAVSLAALGATVVVNAFHSREAGKATTQEIQEAGGDAHFIWASVANEQQRVAMFEEIESRLGGLDFLICNASNGLIGLFEEIRNEDWEKGFQTNVLGLHHMALLGAKLMDKRGGGKIVTLSSTASYRYIKGFGCMAALKSAVESLTRTMAVEFEKYGVSVTCLSPGPVEGDLIKKFPDATRQIQHWKDLSIGRQLVTSREIANFVHVLLLGVIPSLNGSVVVFDHGLNYAL